MTDIHCHILFGLDDGAQDMQESLAMLDAAQNAGVDRIIATPHVRELPFDFAAAEARLQELSPYAAEHNITLALGFEVHWHVLRLLPADMLRRLCLANSSELLMEFSLRRKSAPSDMLKGLHMLQTEGIRPVIAHPERYAFVHRDMQFAFQWQEMDCKLQLDARELKNGLFNRSKACANRLIAAGLYSYCASDAHSPADYAVFAKARKLFEAKRENAASQI